MIVTDPQPWVEVVDGGATVRVWLNDQCSVLVQTNLEGHSVADEFRKAAHHLDEHARLISTRKDRDAAVLVNEINAELNREWPGGTLPQVFTPPPVHRIVACSCDLHARCADCSGDAA